jgi:hypothetical protein
MLESARLGRRELLLAGFTWFFHFRESRQVSGHSSMIRLCVSAAIIFCRRRARDEGCWAKGGGEEEEEEEEAAAAEAEEGLARDEHLAAAATAIRCRSADGKPCLGE